MSPAPDGLSRQAGSLLLRLLEQPEPILSSIALRQHYPDAGKELLGRRLLNAWDSELVDVSDDAGGDLPVSVSSHPGGEGSGYFSEVSGWVKVELGHLTRYKVEVPSSIEAVTIHLAWRPKRSPAPLFAEDVWDLGSARLSPRGKPTEIWFARRLADKAIHDVVSGLVCRRPSPSIRVILTTTPAGLLGETAISGHIVISVLDVIAEGSGAAVDPSILAARLGAEEVPRGKPVYLSADGTALWIREERIGLKSPIHIAIVGLLVEAATHGRGCTTRELLKNKRAPSGARSLDQAFGRKWRLLRPHLGWDGTHWRFLVEA